MNKYTFENGILKVPTSRGIITVRVKEDESYPGIDVNLETQDAIGGYIEGEASLAMIEFDYLDDVIQTVVYGDGLKDEPTNTIKYKNIYEDYKINHTFLRKTNCCNIYNVTVQKGDRTISFEYEVGFACKDLTSEMILESIAQDYQLYEASPNLKEYEANRGDIENIEESYNKLKEDVKSYISIFGEKYMEYLSKKY